MHHTYLKYESFSVKISYYKEIIFVKKEGLLYNPIKGLKHSILYIHMVTSLVIRKPIPIL